MTQVHFGQILFKIFCTSWTWNRVLRRSRSTSITQHILFYAQRLPLGPNNSEFEMNRKCPSDVCAVPGLKLFGSMSVPEIGEGLKIVRALCFELDFMRTYQASTKCKSLSNTQRNVLKLFNFCSKFFVSFVVENNLIFWKNNLKECRVHFIFRFSFWRKTKKISCNVFAWKWQQTLVTSTTKLTKNKKQKMKWTRQKLQ